MTLRRLKGCVTPVGAEPLRHHAVGAFLGPHVIHHTGVAIGHFSSGPVPIPKPFFNRLIAFIRVEVSMATPTQFWIFHFNLNARARCNRTPSVQTFMVQSRDKTAEPLGPNRHAAAHPLGPRHIELVDIDGQLLAIPMQTAWPNLVVLSVAVNVLTAPLGHGPVFAAFAVQSDIQGTVIFRVRHAALKPARQCVIRRKNTPHKSDDGQTMFAIVTQRIDIPPEITTRWDFLVKPRSSISVAAANRPDMAAIGTPGPG